MIHNKLLVLALTGLCFFEPIIPLPAQTTYRDYEATSRSLKQLNTQYPDWTELSSLGKTLGNKDIWVLEVGSGERDQHPGLAIVGGVDGSYVSGPELALRFAEKLLQGSTADSVRTLLDSVTFYIIPNVSPDATEQFFKGIKYERSQNTRPTDDDRDGRVDEDPNEDMNEDGYITMLRIKDPGGEWIRHPSDNRIMIRADKNKGQKGKYILLTEGIDNDRDKDFNEDGEGGIVFNRNMPYKFEHFKPGSGEYPVSEPESRGVLDFLYDRWNTFAVFTFGPSDNLSVPLSYNKVEAEQEIPASIMESDAGIYTFISDKYNDITGGKDHVQVKTVPGGFMQWAYFHYGRLSFSTPAFYVPEIKIKPDSTDAGNNQKEDYHPEVNFLRWADSLMQSPYFMEWTAIAHPDFPGIDVELGGFYPYVQHNPPVEMLDSISDSHNRFLYWLASQRPVAEIINLKSENIGKGLYRIEVDVYNSGLLPAMSGIGEKTRWVKKPRISMQCQEGQEIVSGRSIQLLDQLPGDAAHHLSWLIREKGTLKIEVGAPQTGYQVVELELN